MKLTDYMLIPILFLFGLSNGLFYNALFLNYYYAILIIVFIIFLLKKNFNSQLILNTHTSILSYLAFTTLCFMSVLWSPNINYSLDQSITLLQISIFFFFFYNLLSDNYQFIKYLLMGLVGIIYSNFIFLFYTFNLPYDLLWDNYRYQGLAENPNTLAIQILFGFTSAILLLKDQKSTFFKIYCGLSFPIGVQIILFTGSKKGLAGIVLYMLILLYFISSRRNLKIANLLSISFISLGFFWFLGNISSLYNFEELFFNIQNRLDGLIYIEDNSTSKRLFLIMSGLEKIIQRPFFGYGIGSFNYSYSLYSHNNYIEVAYSLGLIGLLIYYNIFFNIFRTISLIKNNLNRNLFYYLLLIIPILDFANVSYYSQLTFLIISILIVTIERTILLEQK